MDQLPNWEAGPPKSKTESWNYERRNEVLGIAQGLLQAQVASLARSPEVWEEKTSLAELADPEGAVELAVRLQKAADNRCPKV